jgi:hypothetical protein
LSVVLYLTPTLRHATMGYALGIGAL